MRSRRKQDEKGGRWCGDHSAHSSPFLGRFTRDYMMTWQFYHSPIWFGAPVVDVRVIRDERPFSSARFFRAAPTRKTDKRAKHISVSRNCFQLFSGIRVRYYASGVYGDSKLSKLEQLMMP
ncbi:hypothetical protein BHE74_00000647 [Ensete ventricosum]|nr:hypothetical protein BHE74_00000647 [Ensete ventricosum]